MRLEWKDVKSQRKGEPNDFKNLTKLNLTNKQSSLCNKDILKKSFKKIEIKFDTI